MVVVVVVVIRSLLSSLLVTHQQIGYGGLFLLLAIYRWHYLAGCAAIGAFDASTVSARATFNCQCAVVEAALAAVDPAEPIKTKPYC